MTEKMKSSDPLRLPEGTQRQRARSILELAHRRPPGVEALLIEALRREFRSETVRYAVVEAMRRLASPDFVGPLEQALLGVRRPGGGWVWPATAVRALEQIGTKEARAALARLARKAPLARVRHLALQALRRLEGDSLSRDENVAKGREI